MVDEEEWERPIGLTKEYAICLVDSDDDGEDPSRDTDNLGKSVGDQARNNSNSLTSKCSSSLNHGEIDSSVSSYFRKTLDGNYKASSSRGNQGGDRTNASGITRIVDENESPKTKHSSAVKFDDISTESSTNVEHTVGNDNPFASFAYTTGKAAALSPWQPKKRSISTPAYQEPTKKKKSTKVVKQQLKKDLAGAGRSHQFFSKTPSTKIYINAAPVTEQSLKSTVCEVADIQQQQNIERKKERRELIAKWHAFADPNAPIEQQRFQLLVAARIHARCQEPVVRKAMDGLRKYFEEKEFLESIPCDVDARNKEQTYTEQSATGPVTSVQSQQKAGAVRLPHGPGLTVHSLAKSTPETEIAPLLSSVLFGNTKATQIVQAAQDVLVRFGGKVPESMSGLKEITGIGPKLSEILSIVNRRETYL